MGRLLRNIALFSVPFLVMLGWLLAEELPAPYRYNMLQKDCRSGMWIYRRLYASDAPIDVAFIGTSKTMCDVNDSLLEAKVREKYQIALRIANLGICRLGANLHYLLARDLLLHKAPRYVVYEVGTDLAASSHSGFAYMATASDVFGAPFVSNSNYLPDAVQFSWNRLVGHREALLGIERSFDDFLSDSLHSFMNVEIEIVGDSTTMAREKAKRIEAAQAAPKEGIAALIEDIRATYPKHYLQAMKDLCEANGTKLIFLYLPSYGIPNKLPVDADFLKGLGPIWTPPDSIFRDPRLHSDQNHLNGIGAARLSDWLSMQLGQLKDW